MSLEQTYGKININVGNQIKKKKKNESLSNN